ncbi:MAG: hypothetical protein WCR67_06370 [Bacilli bacterium]
MTQEKDQKNFSEEQEEEKEGLSLADIWHMITKHWIGLVIIFVVCALGGGVYGLGLKKPVWSASGSVIIVYDSNSDDDTKTSTVTTTDFLNSFNYVISARDTINDTPIMTLVTESVNAKYSSNYKVSQIKKLVYASARTYTSLEKSLYVDITANTSDKDFTLDLVSITLQTALSTISTDSRYTFLKNRIFVTSTPTKDDISDTSTSATVIIGAGAAIGLVLGILYGIIFELCSTKIGSIRDIESITGLKVIGTIPLLSEDEDESKKEETKNV